MIQRRAPIRKISIRQRQRLAEYAKVKRKWWADGNRPGGGRTCEMAGCPKLAEKQPHHRYGRVGELLCDTRGWAALCHAHHAWCHLNIHGARVLGFICEVGKWNSPIKPEQEAA